MVQRKPCRMDFDILVRYWMPPFGYYCYDQTNYVFVTASTFCPFLSFWWRDNSASCYQAYAAFHFSGFDCDWFVRQIAHVAFAEQDAPPILWYDFLPVFRTTGVTGDFSEASQPLERPTLVHTLQTRNLLCCIFLVYGFPGSFRRESFDPVSRSKSLVLLP